MSNADGFSDLRSDFFGRPEERNALDTTTAYIMIVGSVLVIIFLLFNFSIAVVFIAYGNLQDVFKKMIERDALNWGNFQVRFVLGHTFRPRVVTLASPAALLEHVFHVEKFQVQGCWAGDLCALVREHAGDRSAATPSPDEEALEEILPGAPREQPAQSRGQRTARPTQPQPACPGRADRTAQALDGDGHRGAALIVRSEQ